jgi:hypothetical protein
VILVVVQLFAHIRASKRLLAEHQVRPSLMLFDSRHDVLLFLEMGVIVVWSHKGARLDLGVL